MQVGALGLSTGLEYAPGSYAKTEELIELSKVVSKYNGIYTTHMRNESDTVIEAIEEAIEICKKAEVSLEISHLKARNKNNWHKVDIFLDLIQKEIDNGLPILADRYPYNAYSTGLSAFLPLWSRQGSDDDIIDKLKNDKLFKKIANYTKDKFKDIGEAHRVVISYCSKDGNKKYEGKSIKENAISNNKDPIDFTRELLINDKLNTEIVGFAMDENNLKKILSTPFINLCTDASARAPYGKLSAGKPHPRGFGSFPRMLGKYVREEKIINLSDAIRKMTSQPAKKMQLKNRDELKEKYFADIVIFDPKTVIDKATYTKPRKYPEGINYVIVNGGIALENGIRSNKTFGKILRHKV
jgi:N-acyl-D-amino-acid deacylase